MNESIEFKWLMSFTNDELFERTRLSFLIETIISQTILTFNRTIDN